MIKFIIGKRGDLFFKKGQIMICDDILLSSSWVHITSIDRTTQKKFPFIGRIHYQFNFNKNFENVVHIQIHIYYSRVC